MRPDHWKSACCIVCMAVFSLNYIHFIIYYAYVAKQWIREWNYENSAQSKRIWWDRFSCKYRPVVSFCNWGDSLRSAILCCHHASVAWKHMLLKCSSLLESQRWDCRRRVHAWTFNGINCVLLRSQTTLHIRRSSHRSIKSHRQRL